MTEMRGIISSTVWMDISLHPLAATGAVGWGGRSKGLYLCGPAGEVFSHVMNWRLDVTLNAHKGEDINIYWRKNFSYCLYCASLDLFLIFRHNLHFYSRKVLLQHFHLFILQLDYLSCMFWCLHFEWSFDLWIKFLLFYIFFLTKSLVFDDSMKWQLLLPRTVYV